MGLDTSRLGASNHLLRVENIDREVTALKKRCVELECASVEALQLATALLVMVKKMVEGTKGKASAEILSSIAVIEATLKTEESAESETPKGTEEIGEAVDSEESTVKTGQPISED